MKKMLVFLLMGSVVAGCTSAPGVVEPPAQGPASGTVASTTPAPEMTSTAGPGLNNSTSSSKPLVVTVRPPGLLFGPVQGTPVSTPLPLSPQGWLTFTSPTMGVAVDYPAEWSVTEQGDAATFSSTKGLSIRLGPARDQAGGSQCTTLINASSLAANVCVDTASGLYSATFSLKLADGSTKVLMLSTTDFAAVDVYKVMINSVRPIR